MSALADLDFLTPHLLAAATHHSRRAANLTNVGRDLVGTRPTQRTPGSGRAGRSAPAAGGVAAPPAA